MLDVAGVGTDNGLTAEQIAALEQPATEPTFEKKEDDWYFTVWNWKSGPAYYLQIK